MASDPRHEIDTLLANGWFVVGYNTQMLVMGNICHYVLLQNGTDLRSVSVLYDKDRVMGGRVYNLSVDPASEPPEWS
jgi:hypothetical protein